MKHDYGNVAQIGNALYSMALLSKSSIFGIIDPIFQIAQQGFSLRDLR